MPTTANTFTDVTLDSEGVEMGRHMFRSFLLAGERYLQANMQRPNTDEARFATFYKALPAEAQAPLAGYFKRQAGLDLSQRALLLGSLTTIRIETPLTIYDAAPDLTRVPKFGRIMNELIATRRLQLTPIPKVLPPAAKYNTLRLQLEKLTVEEAQDDYYIWYPFVGKKYYNQTDEVTLGVVCVDETGEVSHQALTIGDIDEGKSKSYGGDGLELFAFDLREGKTFPKFYSILVAAIERDNGGYNQLLEKAANYVKDKVTKELLAKGIVATGAYFGITIPPGVANYIANAVKSFFDGLINWLSGILTNKDDLLGTATATATINSLDGAWQATGTLNAAPFDWVFAGQDGRWRTTMHWQLVKR